MTCTQQFWEFFKPLAESVPGVTTVKRSGGDKMDRLIGSSRSEDVYPAIFLMRSKYTLQGNGADNMVAWFDAVFYVVCYGDLGSEEAEDAAFDEAERLATELLVKIQEQEADYTVLADPEAKILMEPVSLIDANASYGYEVRYRIGLHVNETIYESI